MWSCACRQSKSAGRRPFRWQPLRILVLVGVFVGGACSWWDERAAIRARLNACRDLANAPATEGIGTVRRAAEIGGCFTEDVTVDLGRGAQPVQGRDTLTGMAIRLQARTLEYRLELADVNVTMSPDDESADVRLTAEFIKREAGARQSMDAREFQLRMRRDDGEWRIAQVTAIQTLR